jgi:hypothetical protein
LTENHEIATKKVIFPDSQLTIDRFMKNIRLGRAHYVSYAITTGYKSINYQIQSDQLGYTALHLALVKGYVDVVSELLKYNADCNLRSKIGNYPLHDCWVFWKRIGITKVLRQEQEHKTCELIRLLCGYGANPDTKQISTGSTPLHIACRHGPIHAVILLLGFQADHTIIDHDGKTCVDIAREYENEEIQRILQYWQCIRNHLVHVDFIVQWKIFLQDPEAQISSVSDKSVEKILFELKMQDNLRQQDNHNAQHSGPGGGYLFPVDDDFLLKCKLERNFIEKLRNQNKYYDTTNATDDTATTASSALTTTRTNNTSTSVSNPSTERSYEPGSWQSLTGYGKKKINDSNHLKKNRLPPVRQYYLKVLSANSPSLPRDMDPELRKKNLIARLPSRLMDEEEEEEEVREKAEEGNERADKNDNGGNEKREERDGREEEDNEGKEEEHFDSSTSPDLIPSFFQEQHSQHQQPRVMETNPLPSFNSSISSSSLSPSSSPLPLPNDENQIYSKPQTSQLLQRRKLMAHRMNLDGKFELFTLRPCTSSALNLSHRHETAPLEKTDEEHSLVRFLTTPSQTRKILASEYFGKTKVEKEKIEMFKFTKGIKNTTSIGSYRPMTEMMTTATRGGGVGVYKPTQRQKLYDRLRMTETSGMSTSAALNIPMSTPPVSSSLSTNESYKGKKIIMDPQEKRSLFVSPDLLPPTKELKSLEELKQKLKLEFHNQEEEGEGEGEGEEMRSQSSSSLLSTSMVSRSVAYEDKSSTSILSNGMIDSLEMAKIEREVLEKRKKIPYAEGRLTSTHRMKKIVQDPWSTVKGNYSAGR